MFRAEIGRPPALVRVVHNGIGEPEFAPIAPRADATDIVCLGELRPVKAFDVLIAALAMLKVKGRCVSATIAGEGPQGPALRALAECRGVADLVRFAGYRPAREAFTMGRMLVIPSRPELLPYVVLEAVAAGLPIIATRVDGIPEIFGPLSDNLIPTRMISARWCGRSPARWMRPRTQSARRNWSNRACARNSRSPRWSMAGLPPIARRSRCESLRSSLKRFLHFIYYLGVQIAGGPSRRAGGSESMPAMFKPEPNAIFDTAAAVFEAVSAAPRRTGRAGNRAQSLHRPRRPWPKSRK